MRNIFLAFLSASLLASCDSAEARRDQANCERLKEGMSLAEVLNIMGKPKSQMATDFPTPGLSLSYSEGTLASGALTIQLKGSCDDLRVEYTL
jgi:hypothetical protein